MKEEYLSIDTITRLVELEKENKELKDRYEKSKKQKIKVEDACSNYKYRIDKAIEYIKEEQERTDIDEVINTTKLLSILKNDDEDTPKEDKEKELFYKMRDLKEKLNNHENFNKYELLSELNNIGKEIYEIPLLKEYGELFRMYQEKFDEPLFAGLVEKVGEDNGTMD